MSKQISTKTTIRNLTAEIKKTFVKKDAFTPVEAAANAAIVALLAEGVDRNVNAHHFGRLPGGFLTSCHCRPLLSGSF